MVLQLPAGLIKRFAILAAVVLGTIWLWVAFNQHYSLLDHVSWNINTNRPILDPLPPPDIQEPYDVFDFPALDSDFFRRICEETVWNQSVVFTCDQSVGGIGNIRNSILNCVRYSISAGASLVIPSIVLRNSSDISHIRTGVTTDLSYMFDTQHFVDSLQLSCPSLRIHSLLDDVEGLKNVQNPISLLPESLVQASRTGLSEPGNWRQSFYTWLEQYSSPNIQGPIVIDLGRSYLQYPIYLDGEGFALSFGSILKFRSDVRFLATKTLQSLAETYSFPLDTLLPTIPKAFFGVHLRTEKDAVEGWPAPDWVYSRYETQSRLYLEQAPRSNSSVIYVASGDASEITKFALDATAHNFTVTSKIALLKEPDLNILQNLAWDQQGLVDFLVMLKASDFAGIGHSSFAWNVALKRHIFAKERNHLDGPQMLSDELSMIYGNPRGYPEYAACLWP